MPSEDDDRDSISNEFSELRARITALREKLAKTRRASETAAKDLAEAEGAFARAQSAMREAEDRRVQSNERRSATVSGKK
jgi:chromosome segregation ATPase